MLLERPELVPRDDEPLDPDERTAGRLLLEGALRTDPPLELGRELTAGGRLLGALRTVRAGAVLRDGCCLGRSYAPPLDLPLLEGV